MRRVDLARAALGTALTLAPHRSLEIATGRGPSSETVTRLSRVLGARYLLQAAAGAAIRRRWLAYADVATEIAHAGSMVAVAVRSPMHRRVAATSATVAVTFALTDLRTTPRLTARR